ncbi:MAG: TerB family tellurite resistance protein [Bacteroidia bacterium]|nr:TerB family tellurite resistance protein [Bacteroidia bacterium]
MSRKNKDVAGYEILYILAMVDGDFDPREGQVIVDYVTENFPLGGNLEAAMEELSSTNRDDYPILFQKCAEDFYADSNEQERIDFLKFALKMVKADEKIDSDEDWIINKLYQFWDIS